LSAKGAAGTAFKVTGKFKNGALTTAGVKFSLNLTKQVGLFDNLSAAGFATGDANGQSVALPIILTVGPTVYFVNRTVTYTAKAGKSGAGK
jgi:hypothetical protein